MFVQKAFSEFFCELGGLFSEGILCLQRHTHDRKNTILNQALVVSIKKLTGGNFKSGNSNNKSNKVHKKYI